MNQHTEAAPLGLPVTLHGLTPAWTVHCPQCTHPLADVYQNQVQPRQGRYWLWVTEDRPDLEERLLSWDTRTPQLTTSLDWGQCPRCAGWFALIDVHLHLSEDGSPLALPLDPSSSGPPHLVRAWHEGLPSGWLATQVTTPSGPVHQHVFGPVSVETDLLIWMETTLRPLWADLLVFAERQRPWPDSDLTPRSACLIPDEDPDLEHDPSF